MGNDDITWFHGCCKVMALFSLPFVVLILFVICEIENGLFGQEDLPQQVPMLYKHSARGVVDGFAKKANLNKHQHTQTHI